MAKKKKKGRKRRPQGQQRPSRPAGQAAAATGSALPEQQERRSPAKDRRQAEAERRRKQRRRQQIRRYALIGLLILALLGFIGYRVVQGRIEVGRFNQAAAAAGCGDVQQTAGTGRGSGADAHLESGETVEYENSPPTHGPHAAGSLREGIYTAPFSEDPFDSPTIYEAVHSLEHGYVIAWHNDLTDDELDALENLVRNERKVIVVPYPELEEGRKMALTSWGRKVMCDEPDPEVVERFTTRFRERTAPEPEAP